MTENVQFQDARGGYTYNQEGITFKQIVLHHLRNISTFASVEFRGGFWQTKETPMGGAIVTSKIYVPDSREVYSNAVECLADMLFPYFDKQMLESETNAKAKLKTVLKELATEKEGRLVFANESDKTAYRNERAKICRGLFRALCSFLYRKKYLDLGVVVD